MRRRNWWQKTLKITSNYLLFFLLVAFLVTCTMTLFVSSLSASLNLELTEANLNSAAKLTFFNVILLSILITGLDTLRRKLTTDRMVRHIASATRQIVQGNFDVRIPSLRPVAVDDHYLEIIDCFNKMAQELQGVETLRADFIANVSHEMKTPLAVMQNYSTLLQAPSLTDEKRMEYANAIADGSRRMADMMTNILKLNRLENQKIFPEATAYNLGEQLCECLLQYEHIWERNHIELDTDMEENVIIRADAELMSLVWNNLFSNAFKFTPAGGQVRVTLTTDEASAIVKVSDTGCGMTPEVGAHIFEKFYQGDTSHSTQGNGLGLALVKRVVDILHGEITVESTVDVGTTFTVRIGKSYEELEEL